MIVATSGHVDHGKTLLVHGLTGIETDRLEEEKARGLTIDLGFAYTTIDEQRIGFIDVPGHIKFISNMLAGVSAIDCGLLVIAADDGPMPQTLEHLAILNLIGVSTGAIVLTKIDRVAPERLNDVTLEIQRLVQGTFLQGSPIFPVSGTQRIGLEAVSAYLSDTARQIRREQQHGHFRLAIDRAFSVKGAGQVVTGSVTSGHVSVGDELLLAPQGIAVRVRTIHRQNEPSEHGKPGDRCAINIAGAELARITLHRGNYLTSNPHQAVTGRCDILFNLLASELQTLSRSIHVHVHAGANHVTARLVPLEAAGIAPGTRGLAQLILSAPINLWYGDTLIVRDQAASRTVGGGQVLDPDAPGRGRSSAKRLQELAMLSQHGPLLDTVTTWLNARPQGSDRTHVSRCFNLTEPEVEQAISAPGLLLTRDRIISVEAMARHRSRILKAIEQWQQKHPEERGLPLQNIVGLVRIDSVILDFGLEQLVTEKQLALVGNSYQLPGHATQLSGPLANLWSRIEPVLVKEPTRPPVMHELAKQVNLPPPTAEKLLNQLVGAGYLIRPVPNRYFLPQGIDALRGSVAVTAQKATDGQFSVADFRDTCGLGRNLCIEILEYFDRHGLTQRLGDKRKLRTPALIKNLNKNHTK
ncbi:MAG: selenocysteine-specific elongation factor [Candidatus Azotimanducaceae bacterium]|jgi:selenocysteine-specific elongation factor